MRTSVFSTGNWRPPGRARSRSASPTVGEQLRHEAGAYLEKHGRAEFDIPGITFGTRFDGSPIIVSDGLAPPPDSANTYVPSASPGGRAPHLWLGEDRSLFDMFAFVTAAEARDLYEAPLALIRPDQVVAWRGFDDTNAAEAMSVVTGRQTRS
jgi:hypothetical protein